MSKDPAFLFYPGDWLGGTMAFTLEEKGAYLELLLLQFNQGSFTEAQAKHMLSKCSANVWHNIKHKFSTDNTGYYQKRLREEIAKRKKFAESRRNNALGSKDTKAYAEHMEDENENKDEDIDTKIRKPKKFQPPTLQEVISYFKERGYNAIGAKKAFDYYESNDWHDSKNNPVKNWKQKMIANWQTSEYKIPVEEGAWK